MRNEQYWADSSYAGESAVFQRGNRMGVYEVCNELSARNVELEEENERLRAQVLRMAGEHAETLSTMLKWSQQLDVLEAQLEESNQLVSELRTKLRASRRQLREAGVPVNQPFWGE